MARPKPALILSDDERQKLTTRASRPKSTQRLALRARIVMTCVDEPSNKAVAARQGVCGATVGTWRNRFVTKRLDELVDDPRPGAPRTVTDADIGRLSPGLWKPSLQPRPTGARGAWPRPPECRNRRSVGWAGIRPQAPPGRHGQSLDGPVLRGEGTGCGGVVGRYLSPPERAIVLSVDEKSQVQALDRTQPVRPMTPGQVERGTHDYVRNGTTILFAALDVATGQVIGKCHRRHRHRHHEFLTFLDHVDASLVKEPGVSIHRVLDNDAMHKTPAVKRWLLRHPESHLHFIPTSSSWLNQVERFFTEITEKRIRRGVYKSVRAFEQAIADYLAEHNTDPKPFAWVADADAILDRIKRVCERTSDSGH